MTPDELNKALDELGTDRVRLAQYLGVTRAAVAYWCTGQRPIPKQTELLIKFLLREKERKK